MTKLVGSDKSFETAVIDNVNICGSCTVGAGTVIDEPGTYVCVPAKKNKLRDRNMRVLILANIGLGLYKFRRELLEELVKDNEVYFCIPDDEYVEPIKAIGCQFIDNPLLDRHGTNPIQDLKLISFYKKVLQDIKPDIVFTYTIKCNAYGGMACASLGVPYVANVTGLGMAIENGGLMQKISLALYKMGLRKAQKVFFQNTENRDFMVSRGVVKGACDMLPGSGVNLKMNCVEPYPDDKDGIRFLFVGRIMKDKGIVELLEAIHQIHKEHRNVTLDIVGGSDEDYSEALKKAEQEGSIHYCGFQSDVHPFYTNCHCAVLPSYHEGTANVMLEASSTGRPVITTRVPGCKETFDEGITGFGCEAKSTESLVEAMKKFLSVSQDQRREMGLAARAKMEAEYDRNFVIEAYREEIKRIAAGLPD